MTSLYALLDRDSLHRLCIAIEEMALFCEKLSIPILQYRNKNGDIKEFEEDIAAIGRNFSGKIIVNDSIEAAHMADGLHLGQEDMEEISHDFAEAVKIVRKEFGTEFTLGLSTHNLEEIERANLLDIDYIGLGAYRESVTKDSVNVSGERLLDMARSSVHPVALIGGIRLDEHFGDSIAYKVVGSDLYRAFLADGDHPATLSVQKKEEK